MEKTKNAIKVLLKTGMKVVEAVKDDGKVDLSESMGIAISAVGLVSVFKNIPEIKDEIKNATPEQISTVVAEFKAEFDLPNDEAEKIVETGVEILTNLAVLIFKK